MKKIVYLLGAGATQAEISFSGIGADVTVGGVNRNILEISRRNNGGYYNLLQDLGLPAEQDVELIMSLFEGYRKNNPSSCLKAYREIRKLYRHHIVSEIFRKKVPPRLLSTLLYLNSKFGKDMGKDGEEITSILTTNYDNLAEESSNKVYGGVNYGVMFDSNEYHRCISTPYILKLHGSFNWKITENKLRISSRYQIANEDNLSCLSWVPPSVYKKPSDDNKVFSKIWNQAAKLLVSCDILRVVGSSLRNEDWSLISLIFSSQIKNNKKFEIELIVPIEDATGGDDNSPLAIMTRLKFLGMLKDFAHLPLTFEEGDLKQPNVFHCWLSKKIQEIRLKNNTVVSDMFLKENFLDTIL